MQSLAELEKTPQVIAYKAGKAKLKMEGAKKRADDERIRQVYEPAKLIADRIHNHLLAILWQYADHPDTTASGMEAIALQFEEAVVKVDERLRQ